MITLDLSILNQKGTPMFNSDLFANRPAAGIVGRIFISTDTNVLYRDNGTTWDLLGGGGGSIGGTIAAGQVAFGTATNTIGGENNLFWDRTNDRLGIGTNSPSSILDIYSNTLTQSVLSVGESLASKISINQSSDRFKIFQISRVGSSTAVLSLGSGSGPTSTSGVISVGNDNLIFGYDVAGSFNETYRITTTKNLLLGTTTDAGQRLQVIGDSLLRGSGSTGATSALLVQNSSATTLFELRNDRTVLFSDNSLFAIINSNGSWTFEASLNRNFIINATTRQNAASNSAPFTITGNFSPTSGTNLQNFLILSPAINQTGGANGITRGLYVNPTLSAAADWRSIQWDNNTGWGLYGSGIASSYLAGKLLIGSTIDNTYTLQVTGNQSTTQTTTYTSGVVHSNVVVRNTTFNAGAISGSTGICNFVGTGDNIINGNLTVPNTTSFAGIYQYNKYQFGAAGLTFTVTQASPGGLRAVTQLFTQNVFKGSNSGTITHMAGLQIGGFYSENSGTITPIIPNVYQLLINDTGAYLHTFTFTNRWGIYQEGINDRNYLAGNLLLNSTVDTGQILQVNGAIRINGQASGTAGGTSGNHLIVNVDGTQYKIALLNP